MCFVEQSNKITVIANSTSGTIAMGLTISFSFCIQFMNNSAVRVYKFTGECITF